MSAHSSPAPGRSFLTVASNPLRLLTSRAPWAALAYCVSYIFISGFLFAIALVTVLVAGVLSLLFIGLPLLIGAAVVLRGLAGFERERLKIVQMADEPTDYAPAAGKGLFGQIRTRWSDKATWRNLGYLTLMWPFLFAMNVVAFAVWISFVGLMSLPFWYWSIPNEFPNGEKADGVALGYFPDGPDSSPAGGWGLWVHDLPSAFLAAGIGLALLIFLGNYLLVGAARLHSSIAKHLVGSYRDPLAEAKQVLEHAGPLKRVERETTPDSTNEKDLTNTET